jgi:hypothetical protein
MLPISNTHEQTAADRKEGNLCGLATDRSASLLLLIGVAAAGESDELQGPALHSVWCAGEKTELDGGHPLLLARPRRRGAWLLLVPAMAFPEQRSSGLGSYFTHLFVLRMPSGDVPMF